MAGITLVEKKSPQTGIERELGAHGAPACLATKRQYSARYFADEQPCARQTGDVVGKMPDITEGLRRGERFYAADQNRSKNALIVVSNNSAAVVNWGNPHHASLHDCVDALLGAMSDYIP